MQRIGLAIFAAGALLAAGSAGLTTAAAMTIVASPAALSSAADEFAMAQQISCLRQGWHGVGNYPNCDRPPKKKRVKARQKD